MFSEEQNTNSEIKGQQDHQNLVGFFDLMLRIAIREGIEIEGLNNEQNNND